MASCNLVDEMALLLGLQPHRHARHPLALLGPAAIVYCKSFAIMRFKVFRHMYVTVPNMTLHAYQEFQQAAKLETVPWDTVHNIRQKIDR